MPNCQPLLSANALLPYTDAATLSLVASQTDSSAGKYGIESVAYSPDGSKIVSGASSGTIKVWDAGVLSTSLLPLSAPLTIALCLQSPRTSRQNHSRLPLRAG